jgi:hypothetical protein
MQLTAAVDMSWLPWVNKEEKRAAPPSPGPLGLTNHTKIWIDPSKRAVRDASGRHVIFHGVNVVYKIPPYIPSE